MLECVNEYSILVVCPKIFMQHVWTNFDKNTHTCERSQLKSMKRNILVFKLSLLTYYKFSLEKNTRTKKIVYGYLEWEMSTSFILSEVS